jgi:hypothetical protein
VILVRTFYGDETASVASVDAAWKKLQMPYLSGMYDDNGIKETAFDNRMKYEDSGDSIPEHFPPWLLHAMAFFLGAFPCEFPCYGQENEYEMDFIDCIVVFVFDKGTYQGDGLHYFGINHRGVIHREDWFQHPLGPNEVPADLYSRGVGRLNLPDDAKDAEEFWNDWWSETHPHLGGGLWPGFPKFGY